MNKVLDAYSIPKRFRCLVLHHWHRSRQQYLPAGAVWCVAGADSTAWRATRTTINASTGTSMTFIKRPLVGVWFSGQHEQAS